MNPTPIPQAPESDSPLRQTGRTTRMMQQACKIAAEHPRTPVVVITHTKHYGRELRRKFETPPNIQFILPSEVLGTVGVTAYVFVDNAVYECGCDFDPRHLDEIQRALRTSIPIPKC